MIFIKLAEHPHNSSISSTYYSNRILFWVTVQLLESSETPFSIFPQVVHVYINPSNILETFDGNSKLIFLNLSNETMYLIIHHLLPQVAS